MLITLWVFIGVEGAVVVSARARNKKDVGRATMLAVLSALAVYLMVTLLSLGVVPRSELAEMRNPSMAVLMVELIGPWGDVLIAAGLIISVCGAYPELDHHGGGSAAAGRAARRVSARVRQAEPPSCPVLFAVADQHRGAAGAGADLADRQQL